MAGIIFLKDWYFLGDTEIKTSGSLLSLLTAWADGVEGISIDGFFLMESYLTCIYFGASGWAERWWDGDLEVSILHCFS